MLLKSLSGHVSTSSQQQHIIQDKTYSCANQAAVMAASRSLSCPRAPGLSTRTTTAFWTKLLVTSGDLTFSLSARICLVHDRPKRLVLLGFSGVLDSNVKYENSSELA